MDFYLKLSEIEKYFEEKHPELGVNKKREAVRLAYEIAVRENLENTDFLNFKTKTYAELKKKLLKRRYPRTYPGIPLEKFYLPSICLEKEAAMNISSPAPAPENVYYEKETEGSELLENLRNKFPSAVFTPIKALNEFRRGISPADYNNRTSSFFVVREKYDFSKSCPCTSGCVSCGYFVFNLGFGCPYECVYCFLQGYQNVPGIILPANIEDFFSEFEKKFGNLKKNIRIGSGEFSDSLALDGITGFSKKINAFFSGRKNVFFEFKTKSAKIENLLAVPPSENIVISFSLNPPELAEKNEFFSASFEERLSAMRRLNEYGYSVAFHLDPVIKTPGWREKYSEMIKRISQALPLENIKWVSLGTFRFNPETKKIIENRFPGAEILNEEMILDFDGKLRYPFEDRFELYSFLIGNLLASGLEKRKIYLCMEEAAMWERLALPQEFLWG